LHIVFDLGGVVITWEPEKLLKRIFGDKNTIEKVKREIFEHPDWAELDKGILLLSDVIKRGTGRTELSKQEIENIMEQMFSAIKPVPETLNLIRTLKSRGNKLYVLSNLFEETFNYIREKFSIFEMFDGAVISYKLKMAKPEKQIYKYLLDKFQLKPENTLFIDDKQVNVDAASELGIRTVKFINPSQCRNELKILGII
jgi:putative hydrolase of the HAD superfamily